MCDMTGLVGIGSARRASLLALLAVTLLVSRTYAASCSALTAFSDGWLGINFLVILVSIVIISAVYMLSNFVPGPTRAKITSMTKVELTQVFISAIIITALLGFTTVASGLSTYMTRGLTQSAQTGTGSTQFCDPFQSAEFYVRNLTFNTGISLVSSIYSTSVSYSIDSQAFDALYQGIYANMPAESGITSGVQLGFAKVTFILGSNIGVAYSTFSGALMDVFSPFMMVGMGSLYIQFVLLPLIQALAFAVILPVALIMRSLAFAGQGLRPAANTVLAIAIAAYIVYPMMVSFDPVLMNWIFTQCGSAVSMQNSFGCNPTSGYVGTGYALSNIQAAQFLQSSPINSGINLFNIHFNIPAITTTQFVNALGYLNPASVVSSLQTIANKMSQFLFQSTFLFALDMAITMGFAVGLAKALSSGIEGAASFWSSL